MEPLVIPFFYESFSLYRSRGYSVEDCVELDKEETIDAVVQSLRKNGFEVVPVGDIKELIHCIARGEHERWDLAFSISEGMHGVGREAQVPGVLEAYQIPHVFSDAATLSLCLDKGKTKVCHILLRGDMCGADMSDGARAHGHPDCSFRRRPLVMVHRKGNLPNLGPKSPCRDSETDAIIHQASM